MPASCSRRSASHWPYSRNSGSTTPRAPQLDFEALLRLLFADQTDKATLDRCLAETAEGARWLFDDAVERLLRPYLTDDGGPFPERRHIAALVAAFVADYLHLIERWSEFARGEIRSWPRTDDLGLTDRTRHILDAVLHGKIVLQPDR
jgi:PadR family transcriptional regulator, regulatory protein AphA